jgi:hypothetical protein
VVHAQESRDTGTPSRGVRSVLAVCRDEERAEFLVSLLAGKNDEGLVFVATIAHAYARIKQVIPDLVVLFEIDDDHACLLLSMLKMDVELSGVIVLMNGRGLVEREPEGSVSPVLEDAPWLTHAVMN